MYLETSEGRQVRKQRELQDLQERLDEMGRFGILPTDAFVKRTQQLAERDAQTPTHRDGIQRRLNRLTTRVV